ncbi:MAG: hypothetical protein AB7H88_18090 [Vicinamibacterales bacterium]
MARAIISAETQTAVLTACRRRCAVCFGLNRSTSIVSGQIAHLDQNSGNPSLDNLVFLCLEHHDQFDSRTSQSKGLTAAEVRLFRDELIAVIGHAWRQPIRIGETQVEVQPQDGVSGRWVRGDDFDSAEIEVELIGPARVRVLGFALHGKTWDVGPNFGDLEFESDLTDASASLRELRAGGGEYTLVLRFDGDSVIATEDGAFGHFGAGAHFGGHYRRPELPTQTDISAIRKALG